jgi:hemoglobin
VLCALLAAGCGAVPPKEGTTPATQKSLYDRLGGKDALTAVVDDFVARLAADKRVNARFSNSDIPHLKAMLVEQICEAAGGPCKYSGKDMKTAHTGMNITDEEFGALVEDLGASLTQFKVGKTEQDQLVGALAPMKPQIVGQ